MDIKNVKNGDHIRKLRLFKVIVISIYLIYLKQTIHCFVWNSYESCKLFLSTFFNSGYGILFYYVFIKLLISTKIRFEKSVESEAINRGTVNIDSRSLVYRNRSPSAFLESPQPKEQACMLGKIS